MKSLKIAHLPRDFRTDRSSGSGHCNTLQGLHPTRPPSRSFRPVASAVSVSAICFYWWLPLWAFVPITAAGQRGILTPLPHIHSRLHQESPFQQHIRFSNVNYPTDLTVA